MFIRLRNYGCAFCAMRFDSTEDLNSHEKMHLKSRKVPKPKPNPDDPDRVKRNTKQGGVQEHDVSDGPPCFICNAVCKDASNYKNHILSHYYRYYLLLFVYSVQNNIKIFINVLENLMIMFLSGLGHIL